jgi:hypothetical protein
MKIIAAYAIFTGTVMSLLPQTGAAGSLQSLDSARYLNMGNGRPDPEFAEFSFDSAGNLFATVNNFSAPSERIYKLSSNTVASGNATAANWAPWYTAPTGYKVNGLAYDTPNSRLLWADNSAALGGTKIQASATTGATASATAVISSLAVDVDGLQINNKGNLVAIDTASGAKLVNLGTGTPGTVTNLTDGAACSTTVAIYKADAWCSDSVGKVIRLVGAGEL